jgi:hypothetical protein
MFDSAAVRQADLSTLPELLRTFMSPEQNVEFFMGNRRLW